MRRRFRWDKKYLYWGITAFLVIAAAVLFYMLLQHLPDIRFMMVDRHVGADFFHEIGLGGGPDRGHDPRPAQLAELPARLHELAANGTADAL